MPQLELKILLAILSCLAIKQWGTSTITGTGYVTFPLAFQHTNYKALVTAIEDTENKLNYKATTGEKTTTTVYVAMYLNESHSTYPASFDWIAIGY